MYVLLICLLSINVTFVEQTTYIKNSNTSQNEMYAIVSNYIPDSESFREKVSLLKTGNLVWSQEFQGKSHFYISNTGTVVSIIRHGSDAILNFYDQNGISQNSIKVPFPHGGNFTKDGKLFFFLSGSNGLSVFDQSGNEINNFGTCHKYAFSNDGRTVALVHENNFTVYIDKIPVWQTSVPSAHVRSVVISDDGAILALIDNQYLYVYDLTANCQKYRVSIKNPTVLAMSPDGGLIAVAKEERHATSHISVLLYNLENEVVWEWSRILDHDYETIHHIDFTENDYLHVYATDDLFRFSIK